MLLYKKDRFLENTIVNSTSSTGDYEGLYVADFETSKVNEIDNEVGKLDKIDNTYHGSMSLKDIKDGKKEKLTMHVKWEDHGLDTVVDPEEETQTSDFIEMSFKVVQKK